MGRGASEVSGSCCLGGGRGDPAECRDRHLGCACEVQWAMNLRPRLLSQHTAGICTASQALRAACLLLSRYFKLQF